MNLGPKVIYTFQIFLQQFVTEVIAVKSQNKNIRLRCNKQNKIFSAIKSS